MPETELRAKRPPLAFLALVLAAFALGGFFVWTLSVPRPPLHLPPVANQAGFAPLVAKVEPAVVQISATETPNSNQLAQNEEQPNLPNDALGSLLRRFFEQYGGAERQSEVHALGSGFLFDPDGYIVTNNHVVNGARDIAVTLTNGESYTAKVVGRDQKTDIAVLKIDAGKRLPYLAFGDSDRERVGDWVISVGNPYGLGGTVTAGIISAHGRDINQGPYDDYLQIDAPINPGNSGGPLFDQSGYVIGIDTAIFTPTGASVGIGFAIPSNVAKSVVRDLRERGTVARGWLGVQMQPITEPLAKAMNLKHVQGVLVDGVQNGSPAQRAGLKSGDIITAYAATETKVPRDLAIAVAGTQSGQTVQLKVWRDRKEETVPVTIAREKPERVASLAPPQVAPKAVPWSMGMTLLPLTSDVRSELGLGTGGTGVVVSRVDPGSQAEDSGIHTGDIIERVAGDPIATPAQVFRDIASAQQQGREAVPLEIRRGGSKYYVGFKLPAG